MTLTDHTVPEAAPAPACGSGALAGMHEISCDKGALRLQLSRSSLYRMDALVREGFKSVPAVDGTEAGGILIGTLAPDGSIVRLLDVVPIRIEHRFGRGFRPSEADLQKIGQVITEHSNGPRCVIGYFRSHLEENAVSLRTEDEHLLRRFFAGRGCSVILVQPNAAGQTTAFFCQWDGGDRVRLVERIPLVTKQLHWETNGHRTGGASDGIEVPPPRGVHPVWGQASPLIPGPYEIASTRLRFGKTAILALAVMALTAVFALGRFTRPPKPAVITPMLDLTVAVRGGTLDVKWNPGSPAIADSERGTLDFVDGVELKRIDLNQAQLRAGHYSIVPTHRDLTCLMTVYRKHDVFVGETKSVHLNLPQNARVFPPAPPILPALAPEEPDEATPGSKPLSPTPPSTAVAARQKAPETKKPLPARSLPAAKTVKSPVYLRGAKFTPPPVRASIEPVPQLEDPPKLAVSEPSPPTPSLPTSALHAAADGPSGGFAAATPIARANPVLSPAEKHAIFLELSIRVSVKIDRKGRVTSAHAIDPRTSMEKLLAPHAVEAARLWRFNPALRNGMPVASETVLVFPFSRSR